MVKYEIFECQNKFYIKFVIYGFEHIRQFDS